MPVSRTACADPASLGWIYDGPRRGDTLPLVIVIDSRFSADPAPGYWGFQVTFRGLDGAPRGVVHIVDPDSTQLLIDSAGIPYVTHTTLGTFGAGTDTREWRLEFVYPLEPTCDSVVAHISGLRGNGDATSAGDETAVGAWVPSSCPIILTGDVGLNGSVTSADVIYLIGYLFQSGVPPLPCAASGDVNCDGRVTAGDAIYLINFIFKGGAPPCDVCRLVCLGVWDCP